MDHKSNIKSTKSERKLKSPSSSYTSLASSNTTSGHARKSSTDISKSSTSLQKSDHDLSNLNTSSATLQEDPLAPFNLTPEQRQAFELFNQTPESQSALPDDPFRFEINKLRFIKGYEWKVDVAKEMYSKAIKWRRDHTPWRTKREEIQADLDRGVVQLLGKNKKGEPAFLVRVGKYDKSLWKMDDLARVTFYLCEEALRMLQPPLMTTVFVIDLSGFQMNQYSAEMREKLISPMALVYPEMLGKGFTISTPFLFESLWRIIKPFLHPVTVAKISVDGKNYHKHLMEAFDPEILPEEYRNEEMRQMIVEKSHLSEEGNANEEDSDDGILQDGKKSDGEEAFEDLEDQEETKLDPDSVILSSSGIMKNSVNNYVEKFFVLNPGRLIIYTSKAKRRDKSMEIDLTGCKVDWSQSKKALVLRKDSQDQIFEEYGGDGERLYLPTMQAARLTCKFRINDKTSSLNQWFETLNKQIHYTNSQAVPVKSNLLKLLDEYALQKINDSVHKNLEPISQEQQQIEKAVLQLEKSFQHLQHKIDSIDRANRSQLRQIIVVIIISLILAKYLFNERVQI